MMVCCPQAWRSQTSWTWSLMMLTPTNLTTNPSECPWTDNALFEQLLQNFSLSQEATRGFVGMRPVTSFAGKAIKQFFSTSPKTLTFDLAPLYREAKLSASEIKEVWKQCHHPLPVRKTTQWFPDFSKICLFFRYSILYCLCLHLLKAIVFPVLLYGCESWTVKKAERRRIDAFELWC